MGNRLSSVMLYPSDKVVKVKNWKLALLWVILQIGIICYICVYSIALNKGYQRFDTAIGSLNFKAKGIAFARHTNIPYDSVDLVYPSLENDGFFLATNFLQTDQVQNNTVGCPDLASPCPTLACSTPNNNNQDRGAGLAKLTGQCSHGYCNAIGWCPLEDKNSATTTLTGIEDFTLQVTLRGYFPLLASPQKFSIFPDDSGFEQPQFPSIEELMNLPSVRGSFGGSRLNNTLRAGAVLLLMVNFDCNLDHTSNCSSSFTNEWVAIDDRFKFRAYSYSTVLEPIPGTSVNGSEPLTKPVNIRSMFTYTGIRIITVVGGRAGKFNPGAFLTTVGAGIGLLSVATLITDFIMKRCGRNAGKYAAATEQVVYDNDDMTDADDGHPASVTGMDVMDHRHLSVERIPSIEAIKSGRMKPNPTAKDGTTANTTSGESNGDYELFERR